MKARWLALIWLLAALWCGWWVQHNPLPDGYQNEFLHVGNAYDLWGALQAGDLWHLRWYMYTGYWPWGFHAVAWPFLAVVGLSRGALVASNLLHLGVLLWGSNRLGRAFAAPWAPLLVLLCPGSFGALVRYEPNLAVIAWTTAGLAALVGSAGLRERRATLGWGLCLGLGLMMDRLTVGFFLLPALLPLLPALWGPEARRARVNLALAGGLGILLTAAYYREFFLRHSDELLGQAPVGEIDAAGTITATGGLFSALYYPLTLVDGQAGLVLGGAMLLALGAFVLRSFRERGSHPQRLVLLCAVLPPALLFTLIAKKQAYYTLPLLAPLALMVAASPRLRWVGLLGGLWAFGVDGLGWLPGQGVVTRGLPEALVSPRHLLARPPSHERWPLAQAIATLPREPGDLAARRSAAPGADGPTIAVFSEDERLYEGFVALAVREGLQGAQARGVTLDPVGTYELIDHSQALLWVGPKGGGWPDARDVKMQLLGDHYDLRELPAVADRAAAAGEDFEETGRWPAGDLDLVVFARKAPAR